MARHRPLVHLGVYGLTEAIHRDIQPLRRNVHETVAYLATTPAVAVFNHPFHFYREQVPLRDYVDLLGRTPAVEARNAPCCLRTMILRNGSAAR